MYNKITFLIVVVLSSASSAAPERDLFSDTWVATDALGRQLPGYEECGPVRADRAVGIFYFLWLGQHGTGGPFDITRLLAEDPDSPQWGPPGAFHHWGRAELGYYLSDSEYVIRKHAFMLNDAGIDTLIFDVTNAFTYYYYQMISYIRRYKGVRRRRRAESDYSIQIDGRFDDWKDAGPEFRDRIGDTAHRDEQGWGNAGRYVNKTGRNDFVTLKVACDRQNVYFYAKAAAPITSWQDPNWMLLFIDADRDSKTGWNGYDYHINGNVTNRLQTSVEYYDRQKGWTQKSAIRYRTVRNQIEVEVPRAILNLTTEKFSFDFHWADNIQKDGDIIEFAISGDSAPNRRFNYRFERR